ncbi:hypothetical protein [Streptomyces sp. NPDC001480]|uniref:hypothetical protein n=1 Tax=Streptomyces sp. NPDC001480 TaxID=3364577 RepID=UPI00367B23F4
MGRAPGGVRPYRELLRLDRPVGAWLLVVPGWIALGAIAGPRDGGLLGLLLLVYGVLSRRAACGLNDDREADVRVGVRSAVVLLGRHGPTLVGGVYAGCVVLLAWFGVVAGLGPLYWPGLCVVAGQLGWQVWRADPADVGACGRAFGTNPLCGLLILVAVLAGRIGTLG